MGEDRQGRAGKGFPCRLRCGRGQGGLVAWAGGFQGTNTVPLPSLSQSGGPFLLPLAIITNFILKNQKTKNK